MRAALSFAAGWAALVCVGGTAWLAWRLWRKGPRVDPWSDDAYTAALEADAAARAVRGALAELDELEAWWNLPAAGERAPG